jgi:putative oxidoreductase
MNDRDERRAAVSLVVACWMVRAALAASFLSAVADRLGLWGPLGTQGVSWGSVPKYEEYVAQLNWFLPAELVPAVGWVATTCEVTLAIGLLIGWRLSRVAVAAGLLLTTFAVAMAVALGPKSPLDYSVPSAAAAAFLLAAVSWPARSGKIGFDRSRQSCAMREP